MALTLTHKTSDGNAEDRKYENPPQGNHVAVCYGVIELGTQFHPKEQDPYKQWYPEVRILWETSDEKMEDGRPFTVGKVYRASLHESANLCKDLISWRARPFQPGESFSLGNMLGHPAMLNVVHTTPNEQGNFWANVDTIAPLPKRMPVPDQINPNVLYEIEQGPPGENVPEFLRAKILKAREFGGKGDGSAAASTSAMDRPPPTNGRAMFAWAKGVEEQGGVNILKWLDSWARLEGFPARFVDWSADQVAAAYLAATAKLQTVATPAPPPPEMVRPAAPTREAGSDDDEGIPF